MMSFPKFTLNLSLAEVLHLNYQHLAAVMPPVHRISAHLINLRFSCDLG